MLDTSDSRGGQWVRALVRWAPLLFLEAVAVGVHFWMADHPDLVGDAFHGRLTETERLAMARVVGRHGLLVFGGLGVATLVARARGWILSARRVALFGGVLLVPAVWSIIRAPEMAESPWLTLLFAALGGAGLAATARAIGFGVPPVEASGPAEGHREGLDHAILFALAASYVWVIADTQGRHHHDLHTGAYDLGIYTSLLWNTLQGDFLACPFIKGGTHMSAHFDPILALFSPLLALWRDAEALIGLQAAWLAAGVYPIYHLARHHLRHFQGARAIALAFAVAYLTHPALHGINLFDFHSLALSVPVIPWVVYFAERRAWRRYAGALVFLLLVREDMAFQGLCVGLYLLAARRERRAGLMTIGASIAWLVIVKTVFMGDASLLMKESEQSYAYGSYFRGLTPRGSGMKGMVMNLLTNPMLVAESVFQPGRLLYWAQLLVPLGLLPFFAGWRALLVAYGLTFTALATKDVVYSVQFHYSATLLPGLFCAAIFGAGALLRRRPGAGRPIAGWVLGAALCAGAAGALWPPEGRELKAAWYVIEDELAPGAVARYRALERLKERIGPDTAVCASGFALPHFAARQHIYHAPECRDAEWVVFLDRQLHRHEKDQLAALRDDPAVEQVLSTERLWAFRRPPDHPIEIEP
jgi:uncharacterized membrane protein